MSELDVVLEAMGLSEEGAKKALLVFSEAVISRVEEVKDELASEVGSTIETLQEQHDELMQMMLSIFVGDNDERAAALRKLGAAVRARAVDSHSDDWGGEAPDDHDTNIASVKGKRQGDRGFGEDIELQKRQALSVFFETTSDMTEEQRSRFRDLVEGVEFDGDTNDFRNRLTDLKTAHGLGDIARYSDAISRHVRRG